MHDEHEPTNEYDGPNPLERFAESVKILIEKLEIPLAIQRLQAPDLEKYRQYVKRHHDRGTLREQREMIGRIAHELKRRPQMSAEGLAELLGCTADLVRTVKAKRSNGAR
jgi:hypothetical protein